MTETDDLVNAQDVEALLRIAVQVAAAPVTGGLREALALERMCGLVGAPFGVLGRVETTEEPPHATTFHSFVPYGLSTHQLRLVADYMERDGAADPLIEPYAGRILKSKPGDVVVSTRADLLDDDTWYGARHVQELRRPLDMDACVLVYLRLEGVGRAVGVSVHRRWGEPMFTEREVALLRLAWVALGELVGWVPQPAGALLRLPSGKVQELPRASQGLAHAQLSPRELEVAVLVSQGLTNKQIAQTLGSAYETVKSQVGSVLRKTGVSNRTELTYLMHNP